MNRGREQGDARGQCVAVCPKKDAVACKQVLIEGWLWWGKRIRGQAVFDEWGQALEHRPSLVFIAVEVFQEVSHGRGCADQIDAGVLVWVFVGHPVELRNDVVWMGMRLAPGMVVVEGGSPEESPGFSDGDGRDGRWSGGAIADVPVGTDVGERGVVEHGGLLSPGTDSKE